MLNAAGLTLGGLAGNTVSDASTDRATIGEDFDEFLTLLTTQLQNQDPLDPTDSKELTNQLVGFSQVEQQISMNEKLQQISNLNEASLVNSAVSFIDKTIRYEGNFFAYDGSETIDATYYLADNAFQTKISILDEDNNVVFSTDGELLQGEHQFTWDGKDNFGNDVAAGNYQLQVGAQDKSESAIQTSTLVPGEVSGVEIIDGNVFLIMNDLLIGMDQVLSVRG